MAPTDQITSQLDRLASLEPGPFPVVSLYLNLQPDQHGRDNFEPFLRKELADRVRTYAAQGPERASLQKDAERIRSHVATIDPAANGLALFACAAGDLFESIPLAAPLTEHCLYISDQPHLYPLARVLDEYPRYAVLLADTHAARIFVLAANRVETERDIAGVKTRRHKMGGWSQARYQRHIENYHLHHAKDIAEALARIVRDERIATILISGDEAIVPLLKEELPKDVADCVIDTMRLDMHAPQADVLDASLAIMREQHAASDRERVDALFDNYRGGGLACVGVEDTLKAFELGQVDELLITGMPDALDAGASADATRAPADRTPEERAADALIAQARQTSARIRFVQDPALLAAVGGAAAFLRFKL
jgi:peptide chain release factor subunit 1